MRRILAVLLLLTSAGASDAAQPVQIVPQKVIQAKSIMVRAYWPGATRADETGVQVDGERFIEKWKRYAIVQDLDGADIVALIVVQPFTVQPGFWQRVAWGMAASQAGTKCQGQSYGDSTWTAQCTTQPAPAPLMPSMVLAGSILVYDAADLRANLIKAEPIMVAFAEHRGGTPLIAAGKKLRKMIELAAKQDHR